ncbi:MAG: glutamine-hydrolyzing GMP synthase [Leptospiraceae bacterium]|nr:glutamine-hydrolyzing GMP synthase [Leptospiraceae bacterium]MCP5497951.1 glutamine-hydrolyzing GMP synthase [Leptospiraceae bacterium]
MKIEKKIGIIDFGGQYAHLISSRIRRLGAYTEILSNEESLDKYKEYSGIIFSGGPQSVYDNNAPKIDKEVLELNIPILGICYGHQLLIKMLSGEVSHSHNREYGYAELHIDKNKENKITNGLESLEKVWMSHGDEVTSLPNDFTAFGWSESCKYAAVMNEKKNIYGIQFHPEVYHTYNGKVFLANFIKICGLSGSWDLQKFLDWKVREIQYRVPDGKKVFMLVSGGVDSTVSYVLLARALGKERIKGLLVDTGFMRKNEVLQLKEILHSMDFDLFVADESELFYRSLEGITDPEAKRKIIGKLFVDVRDKVADKLHLNELEWMLGQGTIYPDTIESGGTKHSQNIKTHHNRVEAILDLMEKGLVVEPIKDLYKDEVRELGVLLGIEKEWTIRNPFPGPGLAVRMIAQIDKQEDENLSEIQVIISKYPNLECSILPVKSVGVQGDQRSYAHCAVLNDFTEDWNTYNHVATTLINKVESINRVVMSPFQKRLPSKWEINPIQLDRRFSDILREADDIVSTFLVKHNLIEKIWQMPVVLLPLGMEKNRYSIVLRPIESLEAMTANFYPMDRLLLKNMVDSILKTVSDISCVFFDITNKPPGTIEWE